MLLVGPLREGGEKGIPNADGGGISVRKIGPKGEPTDQYWIRCSGGRKSMIVNLKWTVLLILPILLTSCTENTYDDVSNKWEISKEVALENVYSYRISTNDHYMSNIGEDKELNIYDKNGNVIYTWQLPSKPVERIWSPNDQFSLMEFFPINITNVKEVGFQKRWWEFWK